MEIKENRSDPQTTPPTRHGRWVKLDPLSPKYHEFLYQFAIELPDVFSWKFQSSHPSFDAFHQRLAEGMLSIFVVVESRTNAPIGLVTTHQANLQNGTAYLGGGVVSSFRGSGIAIEAFTVYLRYLFKTYNLRKVYVPVPEFMEPRIFSSVGRLLQKEGELEDYVFAAGRWWSQLVFAIYRTEFQKLDTSGGLRPRGRHG